MGFGSACVEMLRSHTDDWVFATVSSVKVRPNFYYGFAIEAGPAKRTLWFKDGLERRRLGLGPVVGSTASQDPPELGALIMGRVVTQDKRYRYEWWYRDAVPLQLLVRVAHGQWEGSEAELQSESRYQPNRQLDNLWVLIRIVLMEDMDVLAEHRTPLHLDRDKERFVCDIAHLFGMPQIFRAYADMLRRFKQPHTPSPAARQEMHELEEMMNNAAWW
jgi:hypothetical protein